MFGVIRCAEVWSLAESGVGKIRKSNKENGMSGVRDWGIRICRLKVEKWSKLKKKNKEKKAEVAVGADKNTQSQV